ncbi:TetR/AcrR family transcriptional regulator [Ferribacterium limneticum]|uniref:TetR/AcrR family transcriptional regulator n=1 Tax=Ferribacterium limneticum TaxID=76259 RepID=UPI001CFB35A0|nr:TetR/AcrR family transcriptional regulator [Ferribacterium limneticum]UCV17823.1 TetR/AcrR family transcriptional regulator [Ferribacterium limneticum]
MDLSFQNIYIARKRIEIDEMARPREFDKQKALLQAMRLFWSKGYEATSISELLKATGLSKSSLYDTFGSKRELFLEAFDEYRKERMRKLHGYLTQCPTALASIHAFFEMVVEHARNEEQPFGCMSCNEAAELGPHDVEVQQLVEQDFVGMEDSFALAIERGIQDGSISPTKDARKLARFLCASHQGLQIMARAKTAPQRLDDTLSVMMSVLE